MTLRSLFEPGDSWIATGDLFTRDDDGDLWFVDHTRALIWTESGPVPPSVVSRAFEGIPQVALAEAYSVAGDGYEVTIGAVAPLPGARLTKSAVQSAMHTLPPQQRPTYVQSVQIPLTAWGRPEIQSLIEDGIPEAREGAIVWRLDAEGQTDRQLSRGSVRRTTKAAGAR